MSASFQASRPRSPLNKDRGPPRSLPSFSRHSSLRNSHSPSQSQLSPPFSPHKEIPIWLSIFFGNLDPVFPRLDHARFNAKITEDVFERAPVRRYTDSSSRSYDSNSGRDLAPQQRLSQDLASVAAIKHLSTTFTDEVLTCVTQGCAICQNINAQSVVYRPLSATRSGYFELPDFAQTGRLMSIIASHTTHITEKAELDWSIGNMPNEKPYVCTLAVPVCAADGECSRVAAVKIQAYIDAILEGRIRPNAVAAEYGVSDLTRGQDFSSTRDGGKVVTDYFGDTGFLETSFPTSDPGSGRLHTVGTTVFIGRPSLQVDDCPKRGQLGCLVYTSNWPKSLLPGPSKNEADDAIDYCSIAASHEKLILESADYRCAMCSELVRARSLLHHPLAFERTSAQTNLDEHLRQLVMRLFRFVNGRWNYQDVNSALGSGSDAHIFDYVVPICRSKSVCEEVARAAAQEFIQQLRPPRMRVIFVGLKPDTDLKVFEGAADEDFEWEREPPRLLVSRPGAEGLMTEKADRGEDPNASSPIPKLRHRLEVERSKRNFLKNMMRTRSGDASGSESEESEIDESTIWVYVRTDLEDGTSEHSAESARQSRSERELVKRVERQLLFQPMMSLDFFLVIEATRNRSRNSTAMPESIEEDDEDLAQGSDDEKEEGSSRHSGDTERSRTAQVLVHRGM